jgi:hypothetical protein
MKEEGVEKENQVFSKAMDIKLLIFTGLWLCILGFYCVILQIEIIFVLWAI